MKQEARGTRGQDLGLRKHERIDKTVVITVTLLMLISLVSIFSTTFLYNNNGSWKQTLLQIVWFAVGTLFALLATLLDKKTWYQLAPIGYAFGILLLVLVLIFYSRTMATYTGAKSWFAIGNFTFQPSEIVKFLYLLMMARLVDQYMDDCEANHYVDHSVKWQLKWDLKFIGKMSLWTLIPMALVILQGDLGTMLVFLVMYTGCVFISGVNWRIILPIAVLLIVIFGLLLFFAIYDREVLYHLGFKDYQFARIDSWLHPFDNTRQDSYQLSQSLKAIGSGQFFGKGLGNFEVYVPVRESDMIFATIGENFGFIGASIVLLLFFIFLFQMVSIAYDTYDSFWITGVTAVVVMFAFHIIENVGMSIGLLPLTGIPLPFVSQGGSAIIMNMLCIGFVLSIKFNAGKSDKQLMKRSVTRGMRRLSDWSESHINQRMRQWL
ncbi:MAG: FtsW/RodA/SpoVE family cell cycle protein [Aerococcus sp.]|nr:FtsW/RodA/SpoVE family cell cycle protein [Aerococcus sp.]